MLYLTFVNMGKSKCRCFCFFGKRKDSILPASTNQIPTVTQTYSIPTQLLPNLDPFEDDQSNDLNVHSHNDHIFIDTKFTTADIEGSEYTPGNTLKINLKYNCPVCLCFFNKILLTKCCNNYLCHHCALDLKSKEDKYQIRCHYCGISPVHLTDVDLGAAVKKYSDSPISTIKGSMSANKWPIISLTIVKEIEDEIENTMRHDPNNQNFRKTFPRFVKEIKSDEEICKSL